MNVAVPLPSASTLNLPPWSAVTLCSAESELTTATVDPGATDCGDVNWKLEMVIFAADAGADPDATALDGVLGAVAVCCVLCDDPHAATKAVSMQVISKQSRRSLCSPRNRVVRIAYP